MELKYCNNCGNTGHTYNKCRHPILSYGIILYNMDSSDNTPKIIMIERKDSLSFIEFIRGKYKSPDNIEYIRLLISRMTNEEKQKLLDNTFDDLWNLLWIHIDSINPKIKKEYEKSKRFFNKIKSGIYIGEKFIKLEDIIKSSDTNYVSNEWEIPKGRRSKGENNKECAIREFEEETNIKSEDYKLINNMIPIIEEYKGINNVRYKHVYYIGVTEKDIKLEININNKEQYTEIKNIEWLSEEECYKKIRDYDDNKKKIIKNFFELYKKLYVEKSLFIKD